MLRLKLLGTSILSLFLFISCNPGVASDDAHPLAGIPLRPIGPALTSGRVSDFAFHPDQWQIHYVAFASGNLWKTENDGITWTARSTTAAYWWYGWNSVTYGGPNGMATEDLDQMWNGSAWVAKSTNATEFTPS